MERKCPSCESKNYVYRYTREPVPHSIEYGKTFSVYECLGCGTFFEEEEEEPEVFDSRSELQKLQNELKSPFLSDFLNNWPKLGL